jgi:hypothetical protein
VVAALALAGAALFIVAGLAVAARRVHIGSGREFELRRRQSLERVSGSLLTEDATPVPDWPRRGPDGRGVRA